MSKRYRLLFFSFPFLSFFVALTGKNINTTPTKLATSLSSLKIYTTPVAHSSTIGVQYISHLLQIQDRERAPPLVQVSAAYGVLQWLLPSHATAFEFRIITKEQCGGESCFLIRNRPFYHISRAPEIQNTSDVLWEAVSTCQVLSLYQGLGTNNLLSFVTQFIYFYGYSFFKRLYLEKSGSKSIGTRANLIIVAAAGACTVVVT